ncbi:MAG: SDR family NAD(P)-dependent oxidoreductase [Desulfamplus sp.]|nr:SDR family NAD(P)-dependent oxidoreductase [Desulfamplus sp.]
MKILVTGGAGYIGSHTCVELLENGWDVIVVDNLSNSSLESLKRVEEITGKKVQFYQADIRDKTALSNIFREHSRTEPSQNNEFLVLTDFTPLL